MYTDPGASTKEAYEISAKSREIARRVLGDKGVEDRIRQRCAVAVGDFSMADLIRFSRFPVPAALEALRSGAPIISDIRMVQAGIQRKGHESEVLCALDFGEELAGAKGITRTSAGFAALGKRIEGAILVIGNAPSALITVCTMIGNGTRPAMVIGTPVGFVNAQESKELLRATDIPSISTVGTRGGTPVAVASINEIIVLHIEDGDR